MRTIKDMYLEYLKEENKSKTTISNYVCGIENFCQVIFNKTFSELNENDKITQNKIDEYKELSLNKVSGGTLKLRLFSVASLIEFLDYEELIIGGAKLFKYITKTIMKSIPVESKEKEILTECEMLELFKAAETLGGCNLERRKLMLFCLCQLGMRRAEIVNIKISDIFIHDTYIQILGKGNKYRKNTLNDKFIELYHDFMDVRKTYKNAGEYLFCSSRSEKMTEDGLYKELQVIYKKTGIKKHLYPHMLRRSYASMMYKKGVEISIIQKLLGHSSESTTRLYLCIDVEDMRAANEYANIF